MLPDSRDPAGPGPLLHLGESFLMDRYPQPGKKSTFREFGKNVRPGVREFYRLDHTHQTVDFVRAKHTGPPDALFGTAAMRGGMPGPGQGRVWPCTPGLLSSEQQSEFLAGEFATAKDLAHQSRPDRLTRMDGNQRRPAARMSHEVVARTGLDDREAGPFQGGCDLLPGKCP